MKLSQAFSLPLQVHLSETEEEVAEVIRRTGKRPVLHLHHLGLLNQSLIAVHAVHLEDEEIDLLARSKVGIVHSPESNMKLASGIARVSEMVRKGLVVGLGTDGCASNNNLDLFKEMDTAAKLGKVGTLDPVNMGATTVLKMATIWGAEVLGLEKEIGTIEVGKKADIITIDLRKPHLTPLQSYVHDRVFSERLGREGCDRQRQGVDEGPRLHGPRCRGSDGPGPRDQCQNKILSSIGPLVSFLSFQARATKKP